jgi:hypothetical protein
MKKILLILLPVFFFMNAEAQVAFSNIDYNVSASADSAGTNLICNVPPFSINFHLTQDSVRMQDKILLVDSQPILITPLKVSGLDKDPGSLDNAGQKEFLQNYSKYEIDYFIKELKIEITDPTGQWVNIKSRNWLIWYFRVGNQPVHVEVKTRVQLFASTLIDNMVLSINAPIVADGDFNKAALIAKQLMDTIEINKE